MAVSKASSLPAISVGFAISILVATWVAGARFEGMERADAQAVVLIQDVSDRQKNILEPRGCSLSRLQSSSSRW